jgi:hypothetical protein
MVSMSANIQRAALQTLSASRRGYSLTTAVRAAGERATADAANSGRARADRIARATLSFIPTAP